MHDGLAKTAVWYVTATTLLKSVTCQLALAEVAVPLAGSVTTAKDVSLLNGKGTNIDETNTNNEIKKKRK